MAVTLHVVMNLAEDLVSMPVLKESKGPMWKYFNFELDESGRPVDHVVCLPAPDGPKWAQTGQDGPRRAQTVPNGPRGDPDTRSGCGLMNIDILYQYDYEISCKIRIELLLPIYMTILPLLWCTVCKHPLKPYVHGPCPTPITESAKQPSLTEKAVQLRIASYKMTEHVIPFPESQSCVALQSIMGKTIANV